MLQRILHVVLVFAAAAGMTFASVSTSDFTAHLDRQVHGIHCSFIPGADTPDVSGSSGCHTTLMSPYSSVMRDSVWGGIPVALPAMAVFAYLLVCAIVLLVVRRDDDPRATGYQALAWGLPFLTSLGFAYLSLHELGATCKLCVGIYSSSTVGLVVSLVAWVQARSAWKSAPAAHPADELDRSERVVDARTHRPEPRDVQPIELASDTVVDGTVGEASETEAERPRRLATASEMDRKLRGGQPINRRVRPEAAREPVGFGVLVGAFALGFVFVLAPVGAYAAQAPDFSRFVGACGTLPHPEDPSHVLVGLGDQSRPVTMLEVLDPLCPSCRGFERRFSQHPAAAQVSRRVLLFPLDNSCNWMVDRALHPGACAVSEAVLCAEEDADEVLAWAFDNQEAIRTAAENDPDAAENMVRERFPSLRDCIGSPRVEAELNRSLRWAVSNQLPVLTPQVYVDETRICDEDTDLGLDYVLTRLTERSSRTSGGAR